ncbi:glycerate kinase [Marinobacter nanhaiticus D15-8W]|uniref:Glycerate kinase n=1 Tax=Marinobacter nanhaiticus D15-8W TaxID=626887 RepID=N6VY22_9GAMM|nr:glycerate kinase [Marinobacter nanhaiticus]ENO12754.1 glycerate kinase [Marinobacter nanhaiticus D15-8W]BES70101.1 glycerate kinase [Marinobacter nanhaiticus D15-8W]
MRVVIAPDSFKECLSAKSVAAFIARGWRQGAPDDDIVQVPLADGGEGSTAALIESRGGSLHAVEVTGPLGGTVTAHYGRVGDGDTVIVEVAEASGLHLVAADSRDALRATSYGTGELIRAAILNRPKKLVMCLGGSATTDGGAGILQALGARLRDADGQDISPGGEGLALLASLDVDPVLDLLDGIQLTVACDVSNPLLGPEGAAAVFGPQKGATSAQVDILGQALARFSKLAEGAGFDIHSFAGSGAAGGIGGMVAGILGATLKSGIELIMETVHLEQRIRGADLVITAEGAIDSQSAFGKTPAGVASLARKYAVPVIGLAGRVGDELAPLHASGLTAAFAIVPGPASLGDAMGNAERNLVQAAEQLARMAIAIASKRRSAPSD